MKTSPSVLPGSIIELLEPRIAPASITFTDVDGDMITVAVTGAATIADLDHAVHRTPSGAGFKITGIELTKHNVFQNADLTITSDLAGGGDGLVNVGGINAKKLDLHDVTIDGNLVQIDVGNKTTATAALNHLTAESFGVPAGGADDAPASFVNGRIETLEVHGDMNKAWIRVAAARKHLADGSIGTIMVDGSLIGGSSAHSGSITASGEITMATIGGDLVGAGGFESGALGTFGKIGTTIVNNVFGGTGKRSGAILTKHGIDNVTVNAGLIGGSGVESGVVGSVLRIAQISVNGDVVGGSGARSGQIVSKNSLGSIFIGGDLQGGAGAESGVVGSAGNIGFVEINGSLNGGKRAFTGAILSGRNINGIEVGDTIQTDPTVQAKFTAIISARGFIGEVQAGAVAGTATNRVIIAASGDPAFGSSGMDLALDSVSIVNSSLAFANIIAGYGILPGHTYKNADAEIGSVFIEEDCLASTIGAGKLVADRIFGGARDVDTDRVLVLRGGQRNLFSRINNVEIAGEVLADNASGTISAFIAEEVSGITAGSGSGVPTLQNGPHNDREVIFDFQDRLAGVINEGQLTPE